MPVAQDLFSVRDKIAVVTGGLGMLGTEYVRTLLAAGAKVAVFDLTALPAAHALRAHADDPGLAFYAVDITKPDAVRGALDAIVAAWGTPSILINNAAIDFPPKKNADETFENYPLEKWNAVLGVNLTGMFVCCQVIGGAMANGAGGSIINISSTYGVVSPDQRLYENFVKPVSYSVTKSGVLNFTRYLATYWARKNVRVNTLVPGGVFANQDEQFVKRYAERTPLGRMADKNEYSGAILFLASDASSYMTGAALVVDGGWTAW